MELMDPTALAFERIEKCRQALARSYDNVERRSTLQAKLNQAEEDFRLLSEVYLRVQAQRSSHTWQGVSAA